MIIHIKPNNKPKLELNLEEINTKLNTGELDGNELAWKAGLVEWILLRNIEGVVIPTPPPLPDEIAVPEKTNVHQDEAISPSHFQHHLNIREDVTEKQFSKLDDEEKIIDKKKAHGNLVKCPICHYHITPIVDVTGTIRHCPKCGYHGDNFISQAKTISLVEEGDSGTTFQPNELLKSNLKHGNSTDSPWKCPHCNLINPPSSHRCDCGYDYIKSQMEKTSDSAYADQSRKFLGGIAHPWRRFFARTIDVTVIGLGLLIIMAYCVGRFFPKYIDEFLKATENPIIASIIIYLLWIPCEAIFLAFTGTTPSKYLFGIRVIHCSGAKLSFRSALQRTFFVWMTGEGLGIPFVTLFTRIFAYYRLTRTGSTLWDSETNSIVTHQRWGFFRAIFCVTAVIGVLILLSFLQGLGNKY